MAGINSIEFFPDPNPSKKDLLKIHLAFNSDDIRKQYVIEINHKQGQGKTLINEINHGLFLVNANLPNQAVEYWLKNKIVKMGVGQELVYFIARIFTLSGRASSKKYSFDK